MTNEQRLALAALAAQIVAMNAAAAETLALLILAECERGRRGGFGIEIRVNVETGRVEVSAG